MERKYYLLPVLPIGENAPDYLDGETIVPEGTTVVVTTRDHNDHMFEGENFDFARELSTSCKSHTTQETLSIKEIIEKCDLVYTDIEKVYSIVDPLDPHRLTVYLKISSALATSTTGDQPLGA